MFLYSSISIDMIAFDSFASFPTSRTAFFEPWWSFANRVANTLHLVKQIVFPDRNS